MFIREISVKEFNAFAEEHNTSFRQSQSYALLKAEHDYEYEIIGYGNYDGLVAAAVVLVKLLDGYLYAYVPDGYIIDYEDRNLLKDFTDAIYKYYKKENITFIKINPQIIVGEIDPHNYKVTYNDNLKLVNVLENCGYTKLSNNMNFEAALPRINAIVDIYDTNFNNLKKNTKNKIRKAFRKGLSLEVATSEQLSILNNFVKAKKKKNDFYYKDYYNTFHRDDSIDYLLVYIDYKEYYNQAKEAYEIEVKRNEVLNEKVRIKPGPKNVNKKMASDKRLLAYKNDISIASKHINEDKKNYIAGALCIRHKDKSTIVISGYDQKYKSYAPNYYLIFAILEYYKDKVHYIDLNGLTADFSKTNKYYGLNQFKLGFSPKIYEYIGEFDLIINNKVYNHLIKKGLLDNEFKQ